MEATATKPGQVNAVVPMRVLVKGRIERQRRYEGNVYTQVITPAADAYSRPQQCEIRSKKKLGDTGEEISTFATLGGFSRKAYQVTDKETGERVTITPIDHTLDAIEG